MCFLKSYGCKRTTDLIHSYFVDLGLDRPGMGALDEADAPSPCCHQVQVGTRGRGRRSFLGLRHATQRNDRSGGEGWHEHVGDMSESLELK
jgi:hypothetical protein